MERLVMAGKTLLAARIANSSHWEIAGYRSAASLLADIEGVSAGQAKGALETGQHLTSLPSMEAASARFALRGRRRPNSPRRPPCTDGPRPCCWPAPSTSSSRPPRSAASGSRPPRRPVTRWLQPGASTPTGHSPTGPTRAGPSVTGARILRTGDGPHRPCGRPSAERQEGVSSRHGSWPGRHLNPVCQADVRYLR
jgi:hypothetical protein